MATRKIFTVGFRILATCVLFAVCFLIGGALSGIAKIAQQVPASTPPGNSPAPVPANLLVSFSILALCVGTVLSYLILRSSWRGWTLTGAIFVSMYGISTVASQLDSIAFLSNKLPQGMIRAIFIQGAITAALFAPLAVLLLGKWRSASPVSPVSNPSPWPPGSLVARVAILVIAFVFLYMFFGYYVAWRNPELQRYYGGSEFASFWAALKSNWIHSPWIYPLAALRALVYAGCVYPLIRMLRASREESALAIALFLTCWTTMLLLPNPLMPASVARSHFWETFGFSLIFGALAGWLLCPRPQAQLKPAAELAVSRL